MITRIWLLIGAILIAAIVPLLAIQLRLQNEALQLTLRWSEHGAKVEMLGSYMDALKTLARLDPANADHYKSEFRSTLASKQDAEDLQDLGSSLTGDLRRQSILFTLLVLAASLVLAGVLSRRIVYRFRGLLEERARAATKLAKVDSLQNWQESARMLVHELRGPLTPISLISSDLESRYLALEPSAFARYLKDGTAILREQTQVLSDLIASFTAFGKLPAPKFQTVNLESMLVHFARLNEELPDGAKLVLGGDLARAGEVELDPMLIQNVLGNLVRNACEANPGVPLDIKLTARGGDAAVKIRVSNAGAAIPPEIAPRIFEPCVSTKSRGATANMGLGLAIAKKIALDHRGDLTLASNTPDDVSFELELPRSPSLEQASI